MGRTTRAAHSKIVNVSELWDRLPPVGRIGRSVVFTNGCFDLLHAGHVHLLEAAAGLGEQLVVGLNGDESIRRLKGPGRPLVPFAERAVLLAGLAAVDWVVGFDDDTPLALIEQLLPDVLAKGGDWPNERIVGRALVLGRGGRVISLPILPGYSSTRMRERIQAIGRRSDTDRRAHPRPAE